MEPVSAEHIEITLGICGGRARIAEHRIRAQAVDCIVQAYRGDDCSIESCF